MLDLGKLAEKLGREHGALHGKLAPKLKCSRCASKRMSFIVHTHAGWDGSGGHNNYAKAKRSASENSDEA